MAGRGAPKGNQNAKKAKDFETAIRKALAQHSEPNALRKIATKVVDEALGGNLWAVGMIADRLDGKPAQQVDFTGELNVACEAAELTDDVLAHIASGGSVGTPDEAPGSSTVN